MNKLYLSIPIVLVFIAFTAISFAQYASPWNRVIILGDNALKFVDALDLGGQNLTGVGWICLTDGCRNSWGNISNTSINFTPTTSLPASNISSGTFGDNTGGGNYTFPDLLTTLKLNVSSPANNATFAGDVKILGTLYGGSPVKISGGLNVTGGNATFSDIFVNSCVGCVIVNGTLINGTVITMNLTNLTVTDNIFLPNNSIFDQYISSLNASKLFNLQALNYQILIDQANISSGLVIPLANTTGTTSSQCSGPNERVANITISNGVLSVVCSNVTTQGVNESGIARNYTSTGASLSGALPNWERIHISGVVTTAGDDSILLTFNSDTNSSYLYRRIQGLVWLYQAVTVNPQKNITMEQHSSTQSRDVDIVIYRGDTSIKGEFYITTYVNSTYAPYKTMGSFNYANTSAVTTFELLPTFTADSYLIVRSETK